MKYTKFEDLPRGTRCLLAGTDQYLVGQKLDVTYLLMRKSMKGECQLLCSHGWRPMSLSGDALVFRVHIRDGVVVAHG